ncbi:MAG TPA: hypothetical protein VJT73_16090, partial [Polyangiaceae bacterium]|nr:hypothetical protein [Polyangiaceae bacterium]
MGPKGVPIAPAALADLASRHGGEVDPAVRSVEVIRIAPLGTGGASDLSPFTARRHLALARETGALLLIDAALAELVPCGRRWVHPRAGWALASILSDVEPEPATFCHATAVIEAGATVHESAHVGA